MRWCKFGATFRAPSFFRAEDASLWTLLVAFQRRERGFGGSNGNGRIAPWGGEISAPQPEKTSLGSWMERSIAPKPGGPTRRGADPALLQFRSVEIRVPAVSRRAIVYQPSTSNTGASRHAQT